MRLNRWFNDYQSADARMYSSSEEQGRVDDQHHQPARPHHRQGCCVYRVQPVRAVHRPVSALYCVLFVYRQVSSLFVYFGHRNRTGSAAITAPLIRKVAVLSRTAWLLHGLQNFVACDSTAHHPWHILIIQNGWQFINRPIRPVRASYPLLNYTDLNWSGSTLFWCKKTIFLWWSELILVRQECGLNEKQATGRRNVNNLICWW